MSTPQQITTHLIPMDEDDLRRNIQRIVVEVPRGVAMPTYPLQAVTWTPNTDGSAYVNNQTITIRAEDMRSGTIRAEDMRVGGINLAPAGVGNTITFTVDDVSPEVVAILTGQSEEETLL